MLPALALAALALAAVSLPVAASLDATAHQTQHRRYNALQRRLLNIDVAALNVCEALQPGHRVHYVASSSYIDTTTRYFSNTVQPPTCVFIPTQAEELAAGLKVIGDAGVAFAVSSGRHAANVGFSSTTGVQIDMKGFQHVLLANDKSYVDIGSGNVWDNVYQALEGTGVNVLGARVSGVGVGGMMAGGGGFSWKTNQHGLGGDTLLQADMVLPNGVLATVNETAHADLFWAIRGGGNQFGIVYNWRLKTVPQSAQVYGGFRTYLADQTDALIDAIADFAANNTDAKASVIPTFASVAGVPLVTMIGFYDGPDPGTSLSMFDNSSTTPLVGDGWATMSYLDMIRSTPGNTTAGQRGLFHTVSLRSVSPAVVRQIANQSAYWGGVELGRSATLIAYNIEPFLADWANDKAKDAAWPHADSPQPFELGITWLSALDDEYYHNVALESIRVITEQANAEGQNVDEMALYPNYAMADTPSEQVFRGSLPRLAALKKKYDPTNVMRQTAYWDF